MSKRYMLAEALQRCAEIWAGLMRIEKCLVRSLVILFGKFYFRNNHQMLGVYRNKCLFLTYITCLLKMAVSEL